MPSGAESSHRTQARGGPTEDDLFYAKIAAVIALVAGTGLLMIHEADVWENPWAHAAPPLLDRWTGEASTAGGIRISLDLTLTRIPASLWPASGNGASDEPDLSGSASLCDSSGRRQVYDIEGSVRDADGRYARLDLQTPAREPAGVRFSELNLEWDGQDGLAAWGWLQRITATGSTLVSTSDPDISRPVRVALHRQADGGAACLQASRLAGH